jgi:purine-binding chemotaxis protein CheW
VQSTEVWVQFTIGNERFALPVGAVAQVVGLGGLQRVAAGGWLGLLPLGGATLPLADGAQLFGDSDCPQSLGRGLVLRGRLPLGISVDDVVGLTAGTACALESRIGLPQLALGALPRSGATTIVIDAERLWHHLRAGLSEGPDGSFALQPLREEGETKREGDGEEVVRTGGGEAVLAARVEDESRRLTESGHGGATVVERDDKRQPVALSQRGLVVQRPTDSPTENGNSSPLQPAQPDLPAPSLGVPSTPDSRLPTPAHPLSLSSSRPVSPAPSRRYAGGEVLVFKAGLPAELAVPMEAVLDVGPLATARPLKGGPAHLAGLVEWRGRRVPLVDLSPRLKSGALETARQTLYLKLAGRAASAVAVSVGELVGTAAVPPASTSTLTYGVPQAWVLGVARLGSRPLVVLDPNSLVVP